MQPGKLRCSPFAVEELADECELEIEGVYLFGWFAFQRRPTPNLESSFQPRNGLGTYPKSRGYRLSPESLLEELDGRHSLIGGHGTGWIHEKLPESIDLNYSVQLSGSG